MAPCNALQSDDCLVGSEIPSGRTAYVVPPEYRDELANIIKNRKQWNEFRLNDQDYYRESTCVEERAIALDERMRIVAGVSGNEVVEYHSNWFFSVLTKADIIREHEEFEVRARKTATVEKKFEGRLTGEDDDQRRGRKPEKTICRRTIAASG